MNMILTYKALTSLRESDRTVSAGNFRKRETGVWRQNASGAGFFGFSVRTGKSYGMRAAPE